jgi:general transcription factor 3C protein 4
MQPFLDDSVKVVVPPWPSGDVGPELKADFRRSLTRQFFGWDNLLNLRMRLSVADLCWVSSMSPVIHTIPLY